MAPRLPRLAVALLLCRLFLVFLSANVLSAHAEVLGGAEHDRTEEEKTLRRRVSSASSNSNGNGDSASTSKVDLEVERALDQLRSLPPRDRSIFSSSKRQPGLLGTASYYAKQIFILLFMNAPSDASGQKDDKTGPVLRKPLATAVKTLEDAAAVQHPDAIWLLAEMNMWGNFTHPRNTRQAFRRYEQLAALNGNSSAQHMLGFLYATALDDAVEQDQARALLHYTFAAKQGSMRSEMAVAYRHLAGIGTPKNCNQASIHYKRVADKSIAWARSGPPGGQSLARDAYRLSEEVGGIYGEGASYSSAGWNAQDTTSNPDQNTAFEDVMEYLELLSKKGNNKATFDLGRLHYEGSRKLKRNFKAAKRYFTIIAREYWSPDDKVQSEAKQGLAKLASKAASYLGRFYLRGEGVRQDYNRALKWFKLGLANGDPFCQYQIGLMHLLGLGMRRDPMIAADYFKAAAKQGWPAAQVHLGKLFLDQGDLFSAIAFFDAAASHGHIEALYNLAEINNNGVGRERSCELATRFYKAVVEKTENLHSSFKEINQAYDEGDTQEALIGYMLEAEQGYEQAQANVAYLLDEQKSLLPLTRLLPWTIPRPAFLRNAFLALIYWTRSAMQSNIDSMVKVGDYYLSGQGIEKDLEKAASSYQSAEMHRSAQAAWNLGWMYENGIGVEQDYHLAWRYYLTARETNAEADLPVRLSVWKLRVRNWWNKVTRGGINPILPEPEAPLKGSWWSWLGGWRNSKRHHYHVDDDDELEAHAHDGLLGDDVYVDLDGNLLESLIMLALAGALALLVYYRQLLQQQQQQQQQQPPPPEQGEFPSQGAAQRTSPGGGASTSISTTANGQASAPAPAPAPASTSASASNPGQQADGGFFPPPDDPNFNTWRAGGVGH